MGDPNAARRYLAALDILDGAGRVAPRHRRRGGIDIDEVTIGTPRIVSDSDEELIAGPDTGAPGLPRVPNETVVDEIEVIGDPRSRETVVDEIEVLGDPRASELGNVASALPEWLSEPFIRATRDPNSTMGNIARSVVTAPLGYTVNDDGTLDDEPTTIGTLLSNRNVERMQTFGERGADALPLGLGDELYSAARGLVLDDEFTPHRQETTNVRGLRPPTLESDRSRYLRERAERTARNPVASQAGTIVGTIPAAVLTPAASGGTIPARVAQATLTGTGLGLVQGAGLSEGGEDLEEDLVIGAGTGALGGGVGQLLGEGVGALGRAYAERFRPAPGLPAPGRDFTPEQWAQARARMDAGDARAFDDMTLRDNLEEEAAIRRIRSTASDAAMTDVRRAGDYHGPGGEGYRGLARDLDETGISPRGSVLEARASDAQARAARIQDRAGRDIGSVRQQMDDAVRSPDPEQRLFTNSDDEIAAELADSRARARAVREAEVRAEQEAADAAAAQALERDMAEPRTGGARGGRRRPQGASMLERPDVDNAPTDRQSFEGLLDDVEEAPAPDLEALARETRAAVNEATDPALVRYSGTIPSLGPNGRAVNVPAGETVDNLRAEAAEMLRAATSPEQRAAAAQLTRLADDMERIRPETYSQAHDRLGRLDEEAGWGSQYPNSPQATPDYVARMRSARRGVRADMDAAVERTLGADSLERLRAARERFGVARTVNQLGQRGVERGAGNRQLTPSDTVVGAASAAREGPWYDRALDAAKGILVNRFLRSNEHAFGAAAFERQSDALARRVVRTLANRPETTAVARYLQVALERGPRAFGSALISAFEEDPAVQEAVTPVVRAMNEDGTPNWEAVPGVRYADEGSPESDEGFGEIDWSVVPGAQYADEYEEEQRRQQR